MIEEKSILTSYKEGKYIIFRFEELGKEKVVKYDLSNGAFVGKSGRYVIGLNSALSKFSLDDFLNSFPDERYRSWLKKVRSSSKGNYYTIGTFLKKIREFAHLEQYYVLGFEKVDWRCKTPVSELPKGYLSIVKTYNLTIHENFIEIYKKYPDIINNIHKMEFTSIDKSGLFYDFYYYTSCFSDLMDLLNVYNYKLDSLLKYIDNLITYEGLQDNYNDLITEIGDYANMASKLRNNFEKYPKYFLTTHKITIRNFERLQQKYDEEKFKQTYDKRFEMKIGDYQFIYPKTVEDMKDEAIQQSNCLASYIKGVIEDNYRIVFMRKKENPEESLVTIQLKNDQPIHYKGKYNRDLTKEEFDVLCLYEKKLQDKKTEVA